MATSRFLRRCALSLAVAGGAALAAAPAVAADAVIYTSNNVQTMDTAIEIMRRAAPDLKVTQVTAGTGALMKRIQAEAAQPLGDVVWGAGFGTLAAYQDSFVPYESPELKSIAPEFRGKDNLWTGSNAHVMVIMVNEKQLNGDAAPKSWSDLFDPKWKRRLIVGDPATSGSSYDQMYGIYEMFGADGFAKLRANADVSRSSGQIYKSVASGEYAVGITMEYAAYAYVAGGQKEIKLVYPSEGTFVSPEGVAIIKNPRNGDAPARKVYDLVLSKKLQEAELEENFRRPTRSDIKVSDFTDLPETSEFKVHVVDPLKAAARYEEVIGAWKAAEGK